MEAVLKRLESVDLTGTQVTAMLKGSARVKLYHDLEGASPATFFAPHNAVALLFPVESGAQGHWIGMWVNPKSKTVHHFDSYGLSPDKEDTYSDDPIVKKLLLQAFYSRCQSAGYKVAYNQTRYQKMVRNDNTCGRQVICRLRMRYLTDAQYAQLLTHSSVPPDDIVTLMTFLALNEDASARSVISSTL